MDRTEVDLDALRYFSSKFRQECEEIEHLRGKTRRMVDALHDDAWVGQGADRFFDEMYEVLLPALQRLSEGLSEASAGAYQIAEIYRQAQQEARENFQSIVWGVPQPGDLHK